MSQTTSTPLVETTPKASIVAAQTPLDVVNAALNDPEVMAVVTKYLGDTAHSPLATIVGTVATAVASHYGLQLSDTTTTGISLIGGAAVGYLWQWASKKWLAPKTPVTQGTTP